MSVPYLRYFIKKSTPDYPEGTSKLSIERDVLFKMLTHHYDYGVNGYMSERTTLEGIFRSLPALADAAWAKYNTPDHQEMGTLSTTAETEDKDRLQVEQQLGDRFVRWLR